MSVLWLIASSALASAELPPGLVSPVRCGTPAFSGLERPELRAEPSGGPRPPASDKLERDAYSVTANELLTDNFAIRWGNSGGVTSREVERLSTSLEASWLEEIDLQGHPVPYGADDYRFNVYIGDTGNGAPSGGGAAGYFWYDPAGWPMVVVSASTLDDPDYADITASHELYHAIQAGTDRYPYEADSAWFWEASATWASATVYPTNLYYASFIFGYAFLPHYPANYFNYADSWDVEDYYQYGAFIIPFHLAERTADRALIREVWTGPAPERDPLSMLQRLLDERGLSFDDAFMDHAARMATFDYPDGSTYRSLAEYYADYFSESDHMVAAEVGPAGTEGLIDGPRSLRPFRYGYNSIRIDIGDADTIEVAVEGQAEGSRGNDAEWGGKLVLMQGGTRTYVELDWRDQSGTVTLDGLDGETIWLVVAAWTDQTRDFDSEQFAYQYSVTLSEDGPDDTGGPEDTGTPQDTGDVADTDTPADPEAPTGGDATHTVEGGAGSGKTSSCSTGLAASFWLGLTGLMGVAGRRRVRST